MSTAWIPLKKGIIDGENAVWLMSDTENRNPIILGEKLSDDETKKFQEEILKLPYKFSFPKLFKAAYEELEKEMIEYRGAETIRDTILEGQLFLFLESDGRGELCGYKISYDSEFGLKVNKKEEDEDA